MRHAHTTPRSEATATHRRSAASTQQRHERSNFVQRRRSEDSVARRTSCSEGIAEMEDFPELADNDELFVIVLEMMMLFEAFNKAESRLEETIKNSLGDLQFDILFQNAALNRKMLDKKIVEVCEKTFFVDPDLLNTTYENVFSYMATISG